MLSEVESESADFCCGGRKENGHGMVLKLVSGAVSTPFFEPDPVAGVVGPSLAAKRPKTETQI